MIGPAEYPIVFLSHKHVDKKIAQILADFLNDESRNAIDIHNSSSDGYLHPETGDRLTDALRNILWKTHVLILIYTSPEHDWSWCMWEAGVANDSQSPDTRIVVLQCMNDAPSLFSGQLNVNIRNQDDVRKFVDDFFRSPTFFPGLGRALTPRWTADGVRRAAGRLSKAFEEVLEDLVPATYANVWPNIRFQVPKADARRVRGEDVGKQQARDILSSAALVADHSASAAEFFGRTRIASMTLAQLKQSWAANSPGEDDGWHDSCCDQMARVIRGETPLVPQAPVKEPGTNTDFIPNLIRHREQSYSNQREFEFFFIDVSNPQAIPVEDRMLIHGEFFCKDVDAFDAASVKLVSLLDELDERGLNRLPFLNGNRHVEYVIHRSMFDKFLVRRRAGMDNVTLADLLADREIGPLVRNSIGVVRASSTVADARAAMTPDTNCLDVFVTENGTRNEPVLGWVTNVDLRRRGRSRATAAE